MKKIKSAEEIAKSQKRTKLIVGSILIFLMAFSTAGYAFYGGGGGYGNDLEDGQDVGPYYNGQYWVYAVNGEQYVFTNAIENVQNVNIEVSNTISSYSGKPLFIDSDNPLATSQLAANLGKFTSRIQEACYGSCDEDLPEKDCSENMIVVTVSEEKSIYQEENCVFVEGDISSVDAFLYKIIGLLE